MTIEGSGNWPLLFALAHPLRHAPRPTVPVYSERVRAMTTTIEPAPTSRSAVVGVFIRPDQAEAALTDLQKAGVTPEQVSVLAKDSQAIATADQAENVALAGATGAITGSVLGGALGFFVGAVLMAIPGVGPVVVAGLLLSTLAGAGIGAASIGLISALTEWGIPMDEATAYETSVDQGHILLLVQATTAAQARAVQVVFVHHHGVEVRTYGLPGDALA